jgi:hypothetical protein
MEGDGARETQGRLGGWLGRLGAGAGESQAGRRGSSAKHATAQAVKAGTVWGPRVEQGPRGTARPPPVRLPCRPPVCLISQALGGLRDALGLLQNLSPAGKRR